MKKLYKATRIIETVFLSDESDLNKKADSAFMEDDFPVITETVITEINNLRQLPNDWCENSIHFLSDDFLTIKEILNNE